MTKLFISYTSNDQKYVEALKEALKTSFEALKIVGEWEPVETSSQKVIHHSIQGRLEAADAMVVLLSPQALASSGVMFEIGAAQALGKKIVPIILPDTDPDQLDFIDRDRAVLDARTLSLSETAKRLEALVTASAT